MDPAQQHDFPGGDNDDNRNCTLSERGKPASKPHRAPSKFTFSFDGARKKLPPRPRSTSPPLVSPLSRSDRQSKMGDIEEDSSSGSGECSSDASSSGGDNDTSVTYFSSLPSPSSDAENELCAETKLFARYDSDLGQDDTIQAIIDTLHTRTSDASHEEDDENDEKNENEAARSSDQRSQRMLALKHLRMTDGLLLFFEAHPATEGSQEFIDRALKGLLAPQEGYLEEEEEEEKREEEEEGERDEEETDSTSSFESGEADDQEGEAVAEKQGNKEEEEDSSSSNDGSSDEEEEAKAETKEVEEKEVKAPVENTFPGRHVQGKDPITYQRKHHPQPPMRMSADNGASATSSTTGATATVTTGAYLYSGSLEDADRMAQMVLIKIRDGPHPGPHYQYYCCRLQDTLDELYRLRATEGTFNKATRS